MAAKRKLHPLKTQRANPKKSSGKRAISAYSDLFDFSPVGFLTLNEKGLILESNLQASKLLGGTRAKLVGQQIGRFIHPKDRSPFLRYQKRTLTNHMKQSSDLRFLKSEGNPFPVHLEGIKTTDGKGIQSQWRLALVDLTQQKRMERLVKEVKAQLAAVVQSAMDAIITINAAQRILVFNAAAEQMFGCSAGEAIGQPIARFIPERFRYAHKSHVKHFGRTGQSSRRTGQLGMVYGLRTNGEEFPIEASISQIQVSGKRLYTVIIRDITERLYKEEALKWISRQQRLVLNAAGEGIYGVDGKGHVMFINPAAEEITGWEKEHLLGRFVHPILHHSKPDGSPYSWEECPIYETLREGKERTVVNEVLWRKDGTKIPVEYTSTPIQDEQGNFEGAVVTFRDITKRKVAEESLQKEQEFIATVLDTAGALVVVLDSRGRIVRVNRACEELTGYSLEELHGKPFLGPSMILPEDVKGGGLTIKSIRSGQFPKTYENTWLTKEGCRRVITWSNTAIRDEAGKVQYMVATGLDITEQKRAEEALRQKEQTIRESREELRALTAQLLTAQEEERRRVSRELHDDMNQRMAVLAFKVQGLQKECSSSNPLKEGLEEIHQDLAAVSDELRSLAYQLHPSILDDMGLVIALRSYGGDLARREGIHVDIRDKEIPGTIPREAASCLYRITQEALRNAVKHGKATSATVTLESSEGGLSLCVLDTGTGFDPEGPAGPRSGIGIIGMQERARLVKGTLSIRSQPGQGTEVCAWVPLPKVES